TGVALILYFRLIEALGSMGVASQAYLRAGIGVALGAVVLGEEVAPTAALGLAATILGVALINRPARG
ncbi:MAG: EamA family transporter, partial [Pseudomonadota bacterium]